MQQLSRKKSNKIQKFIDDNPSLEFKLTNHLFDRLANESPLSQSVTVI